MSAADSLDLGAETHFVWFQQVLRLNDKCWRESQTVASVADNAVLCVFI